MRFWKQMLRLSLLVALHLAANVAHATPPFGCAPGNQDNTCLTAIRSAPIPQPACSTAAGWTTGVAAVWIGSQWSQPQCNFQAEPTCGAGTIQTAAPVWNGVQWVGLGCAPSDPLVQQGGGPVPINGGFVQLLQITMYIPRSGSGTGLDARPGVWALYFTNAAGQFVFALPLSGPGHEIDPPPASAQFLQIDVDPASGVSVSQVHSYLAMTEGDINMNVPSVTASTPNPDVPVCITGISLDACLVPSLPGQPAIAQPLARDINNDN
jgi:hypothetical protein